VHAERETCQYKTEHVEVKDLIPEEFHHPDFDVCTFDTNMHESLTACMEAGDIEAIEKRETGINLFI
jgi:hypothetical protein